MTIKRLINVKLETGRLINEGQLRTSTALYTIDLDDNLITGIYPKDQEPLFTGTTIDIKGRLALPPFKDMHNHLDKTYMTLGWRAALPVSSFPERLAAEASELPLLAPSTERRAKAMIESLMKRGINHIRTHVNIDPYIGLENLEGVLNALQHYDKFITYDIVAFPQHGLLRDKVPQLMREALRSGATIVGGLDPGGIDNAVERSLDEIMSLATLFDADVDIHLHDRGHLGTYTYSKWLDIVAENHYQGRTAISHGFSLGDVSIPEQDELIARLNEQDVKIMSTIPYGLTHQMPPIDRLRQGGVNVHLGCDGFYDSWSSCVSSDVLEKLSTFCELTGKITEEGLADSLSLITNGKQPVTMGQLTWPLVGDPADFIFIEAAASAEIIARKPIDRLVMFNSQILHF